MIYVSFAFRFGSSCLGERKCEFFVTWEAGFVCSKGSRFNLRRNTEESEKKNTQVIGFVEKNLEDSFPQKGIMKGTS